MKLPCYLVRELLPLYHDKVLGEQAAADVGEHLTACPDCRNALQALDADTGAETALQAEQQQTEAAALRRVRRTMGRRRLRWLILLAVLIVAAVLALRVLGQGVYLDLQPGDIAGVYCTENGELHMQVKPGKTYSLYGSRYLTVEDETGTHSVVVFTARVDLWHLATLTGMPQDQVLFYNLLADADAAYFVCGSDWEEVTRPAREGEDAVMTSIPDTMHLVWQRQTTPSTPASAGQ